MSTANSRAKPSFSSVIKAGRRARLSLNRAVKEKFIPLSLTVEPPPGPHQFAFLMAIRFPCLTNSISFLDC